MNLRILALVPAVIATAIAAAQSATVTPNASAVAPAHPLVDLLALGAPRRAVEVIYPESFNRIRGRIDAGDVTSLQGDDTTFLRVCRFIVPTFETSRVMDIDYHGTTNILAPTNWRLDVRSRVTGTGLIEQNVQVFNYQNNTWDATDRSVLRMNTVFTTRTVTGTGTLSRFVGPGGVLRARQAIWIVGPLPVYNFCKETSLVRWTIEG